MTWKLALKRWNELRANKGKGSFCLPRKGTKEYNQVKKIQDTMQKKKEKIEEAKKPKRRIIRRKKKDDE